MTKLNLAVKNDKHGFINNAGEEIIPCIYDHCTEFVNNFSRVELDGKKGRMDINGNVDWEEDTHIIVSCAIIYEENMKEFLAVKRPHHSTLPDKWELPGGKAEPGETTEECIIREIQEELCIDIIPIKKLKPQETIVKGKNIRLIPFVCKKTGGEINLNEHSSMQWLTKENVFSIDWAEGDAKIIRERFNQ